MGKQINKKINNKNLNNKSKKFIDTKNNVNYKINDESEESDDNMPYVQDSVNLPSAVDINNKDKYSGVKSSSSLKTIKI